MAKQTFTTGQVLTAAQMTSLQQTAMLGGAASAKIASYVLVAANAGDAITMSNAGATTITANTGLFAAGDIVTIINIGAGACTITAGTATVTTSGSLVLAQNQGGVLRFTSASAAIFLQFATPASGDIEGVTAGTGISGGGTSGTVTITNSMATEIAAKGDLIVGTGSATFDNLTVGANNTILVADSTASTGLKWATPSSGAMTLIKARTTFSSVANTGTTFDTLFSATYRTYLIVIDQFSSTSAANCLFQLLYSGSTMSANYYHGHQSISWGGAATIVAGTADTSVNLGAMSAGANISNFTVKVYSPQASSDNWKWTWDGYSPTWQGVGVGGAFVNAAQSYTGIKLTGSAGNITGAITVYGLAIS